MGPDIRHETSAITNGYDDVLAIGALRPRSHIATAVVLVIGVKAPTKPAFREILRLCATAYRSKAVAHTL